jgi:hypothetical protein
VVPTLDPNDKAYSELMRSKKRKYADAFPLNSSTDSTDSACSRKKRIMNEVREQSISVYEYEQSIEYLKHNVPDY